MLVIVVAPSVAIACSLTTELDGLAAGERDGGAGPGTADRQGRDAESPFDARPDVRDGSSADSRNLIVNGDFETPGFRCGPTWYEDDDTSRTSERPHGGGSACRICSPSAREYFGVDSPVDLAPNATVGQRYVARAWVRRSAPGAVHAELHVRIYDANEDALQNEGAQVSLTDEWTSVTTELTVEAPPARVNVYAVVLGAPAGACFDIDDVELVRVP